MSDDPIAVTPHDDESEFEAAKQEICDRMMEVDDAEVVMTVDKWVTKLTADDRGPNELNYLKLLQYMMASRRICRPFLSAPPAGPVLPMDAFLRPIRGVVDRLPVPRRSAAPCWRTVNRSLASQTVDDEEDGYDDGVDEYYDDQDDDDDVGRKETGKNERESSRSSGEETGVGPGDATAAEGNAVDGNGETAVAVAAVAAVAVEAEDDKRDGREKAGGGGEYCGGGGGARSGRKRNAYTRNPAADLCDPCLDTLGQHLRKRRPGPMAADYMDMLGDCALPRLTEAERASVDPELLHVLECVNDDTTLQDFYFQVALHTCDQGSLMMRLTQEMMDSFRDFGAYVFESRIEHISDGLTGEQMTVRDRYAYLRDRLLNRATIALHFLKEAVPVFNWNKYKSEPDAYMKREILRKPPGAAGKGDDDAADGSAAGSAAAGTSDGGGGGGGGVADDDEDGAQRQSAIKKMMYTLNWLRAEEARVDCQRNKLYEQRDGLTAGLAELGAQLSATQCESACTIGRHKDEITRLQEQSADQTATIDQLVESIQLSMMNKKSRSTVC